MYNISGMVLTVELHSVHYSYIHDKIQPTDTALDFSYKKSEA